LKREINLRNILIYYLFIAEEEELIAAQQDLRNLWQVMEIQQREFNDPNFDFNVLRTKRKNLEQQYNTLRSQYKLGNVS